MSNSSHFVLFQLAKQSIALPLEKVVRIARSVSITPLPDAPNTIKGVINVQGEILPVIDIRKRFGFPPKPVGLNDHFIVGQISDRKVAIVVDEVMDIIDCATNDISEQSEILPGVPYIEGVIKTDDGVVLIHDLEKLLSFEDIQKIDQSIKLAEKS